jgi:8-oxo-dGTP pyrophosphatase MutT (NUDIX family)
MKDIQSNKAIDDFLVRENVSLLLSDMWVNPDLQRISSLCYIESEGRLLMLQRVKEPFRGFWTAPGGKLEPFEDPRQTVIREIWEETGLTLKDPQLKMINSETGPEPDYNWLVFIFWANEVSGSLEESDEGILKWISKEQILNSQIPEVDRRLLPLIFEAEKRYFVRLKYNDLHQVEYLQSTSY